MYNAIITKLEGVEKHPNADRLMVAKAQGFNVIVGLDSKEGDLVILFPPDGQVSEAYAEANDLVGYTDVNTGERKGGFFAKNRRVRAQRLRGVKSEAYVASLDSLTFTGYDIRQLKVGDIFNELNQIPICNKYYTPATLRQMNRKDQIKRQNKCFPKHMETEKLQYKVGEIPAGSIISITEKIHGTSGRYSYVWDETIVSQGFFKRLHGKVFRRKPQTVVNYDKMIGTRNLILGKTDIGKESYYGSEEFRHNIGKKVFVNIRKGEVVYGEIVGYTHTGGLIMSEQDTSDLKEVKKQYGKQMVYKYGNIPGECTFYVYRIANVNEDGEYVDLSYAQMKRRAKEMFLNVVPELKEPFIYNGNPEYLVALADELMSGPSVLDESHIREGVVFRVETPDGSVDFYKSKSFEFVVLEGYLKNKEDYVDLEEAL